MLRSMLLLTIGFALLPATSFAKDTTCPLHKRLEAQKTAQFAETSPIKASAPAVETPSMSTSRETVATSKASLPEVSPAQTVQLAQNTPPTAYGSATEAPKKEMIMTVSPHADWTAILQRYVSAPDGMGLTHFDYAGLKANAAYLTNLDAYIKRFDTINIADLNRDEAIVHYANLYNALTVDLIVQNYPLDSIRKAKRYNGAKVGGLRGPWKKVKTSVNGQVVALDDIEHKILRVKYPSPYIHYMVNCASVGCPNLLTEAWETKTYESLRKKAASAYINSPRGVVITSKGLKVSSIYKWFKEDFGGKDGVLKHIRDYANADLAAAIDGGAKIIGYDYDWSLNE